MSAFTGLIATLAKVWIYPTLFLCVVGATALGVSWSGTFSQGVGTTGGVVVRDFPKMIESFQNVQQDGAATEPPAEGAEPR